MMGDLSQYINTHLWLCNTEKETHTHTSLLRYETTCGLPNTMSTFQLVITLPAMLFRFL